MAPHPPSPPDLDPHRFPVHAASPRGFRQAFVHEGLGGVPLLCVHGWPETKRIFWKVIEPLAAAGFEVIVPDLRGFGDSDVGPDGFHDVAVARTRPLRARCTTSSATSVSSLLGGDLGGPVIQDLALRHPDWVDRMVLFNSPLPYDKERMAGMRTRPAREASDYFVRQGTDADALAAELRHARRSAVATSPPSTRRGSGPTRARSRDPPSPSGRAGSAARPPSTSTPSRSPTAPSCERRSAATRASFHPSRHASRRLGSGATSGPGR